MPEAVPERAEAIQYITELVQAFHEALENKNADQVLTTQRNLTVAAEMIWAHASNDPNMSGKDRAIVRLLAEGAIRELPEKIQDPANYPQIRRELRLLKSSLLLLA